MRTFKLVAAQGDIMVVKVDAMPANVVPAKVENGHYIVAHSETGHHHVIDRPRAEMFEAADDAFIAYIRTMGDGAEIKHLRNFDTHDTLGLEPDSIYRVHRQRESAPEGWRRAAD